MTRTATPLSDRLGIPTPDVNRSATPLTDRMSPQRHKSTMEELGRRLQVRGTLMYLATASGLSICGKHAEHIERMRAKAEAVGVDPAVVDRIVSDVHQEAAQRGHPASWEDSQIASRLFSAVVLFDEPA